jgi:hypothetical protein
MIVFYSKYSNYVLSKQKSEYLEKKALRIIHNVNVIHENKKQKFIEI